MFIFFVVFIAVIRGLYAQTLDCYSCSYVRNVSNCHQLTVCAVDEYCYTETTGIGDQTRFTLGCRSKQRCLAPPTTTSTDDPLSIIGRAISQYVDCSQCCATHACNKYLCTSGTHGMLFIQGIVKMTQAIIVRTLALYSTFVATFNMRELCVENSVDFVI